MKDKYNWTDNPTVSGVSICDTDVLNDCLMHLKYDKKGGGSSLPLFTPMVFDHILTGEEAMGWALQGSCVTMTYPDAVAKIKQEYEEGVDETDSSQITFRRAVNGRRIADISQKDAIDEVFAVKGIADYYVLDSINNCFYLPKNNHFFQLTCDTNKVNQYNEAGLPNIYGTFPTASIWGRPSGAFAFTGGTGEQDGDGDGARGRTESFDASRSSALYGKSDTVQPISSNKLLYYRVGETVTNSDQALIDASSIYETTKKEIADKVQTGLQVLNQASTSVTYNQITNCLLNITPRINLVLNDGILTLKAGSEIIRPNGFDAETNTKKFDYTVLDKDISATLQNAETTSYVYFVAPDLTLQTVLLTETSSGIENTTTTQNKMLFNTTDNTVSFTNDTGTNWTAGYSLPVGIVHGIKDTGLSSVSQIFNGFGFIGSIAFADKGTKVLIPDGKNDDNTLKNIEYTTSNLLLYEVIGTINQELVLDSGKDSIDLLTNAEYNDTKNIWTDITTGNKLNIVPVARIKAEAGSISSLSLYSSFKALSYGDKKTIVNWAMPDWSAPVGRLNDTTYVAEQDGWVYGDIYTSASGYASYIFINGGIRCTCASGSSGNWGKGGCIIVPVAKGDTYRFQQDWSTRWFVPCKGGR